MSLSPKHYFGDIDNFYTTFLNKINTSRVNGICHIVCDSIHPPLSLFSEVNSVNVSYVLKQQCFQEYTISPMLRMIMHNMYIYLSLSALISQTIIWQMVTIYHSHFHPREICITAIACLMPLVSETKSHFPHGKHTYQPAKYKQMFIKIHWHVFNVHLYDWKLAWNDMKTTIH